MGICGIKAQIGMCPEASLLTSVAQGRSRRFTSATPMAGMEMSKCLSCWIRGKSPQFIHVMERAFLKRE